MFEDRISALNNETEAMPTAQYEKRIYTVDEIQDILNITRDWSARPRKTVHSAA